MKTFMIFCSLLFTFTFITYLEYSRTTYVQNYFESVVDLDQRNFSTAWLMQESRDLSNLIRKRIYHVQNPKNCTSARKLICEMRLNCGYGCHMHNLGYCLIAAYATERTLVVDPVGFKYMANTTKGLTTVLKPFSDTCMSMSGETKVWGEKDYEKAQVVHFPRIKLFKKMAPPEFIPPAIPEDLATRIRNIHSFPPLWWVAQFLNYMIQPQPKLASTIDSLKKEMGFKSPIVGLHVRRSDKVGDEAEFHSIAKYMEWVAEYYDKLSKVRTIDKRRVFIATDDVEVVTEARATFPDYTFLNLPNLSKIASKVGNRYTEDNLKGVITDIHFLSHTDYLVCTFTSNICRMSYELMQTLQLDAAANFHSLDLSYQYVWQNPHKYKAIQNHKANTSSNEIQLKIGDELKLERVVQGKNMIYIERKYPNGFFKGLNKRTSKEGYIPVDKVKKKLTLVKFPTYPEVGS